MAKLFITFAIFFGLLNWQIPKDITGKWLVENIDVSKMTTKLTPQQKEIMNKSLVKPFTNAVFDFEPDHHFYLSANFGNMPKDDYWEYSDVSGIITIKEYNHPKSIIMKISISEKDGYTFFSLQESSVVLKMHKK